MSLADLKSLSGGELSAFIAGIGLPGFRTRQLIHWIYERKALSIGEITEFSKDLRERLGKVAFISNLNLLDRRGAADGTEKFLFGLEAGESIECVLIPDEDRRTLCISSQAGCAMACRFCLTGALRLKRDLRAHEIVDQVIAAGRLLEKERITNIVFMGMGEPLANLENVAEAIRRITGFMKFSPRRITLSTAGIVPGMLELPKQAPAVNLAVSLNATTDEVRNAIMPVNRTYPIRALLDACRKYPVPPRRRITFEYVLLKGVNDTPEDASRLVALLRGIPAKVNLIPFNPYPGADFERPEDERVLRFQDILLAGGLTALIRKSKGGEIGAACGQLRAGYC